MGVVVLLSGAAMVVAGYAVAYHRVRAAADLAAVSAAAAFEQGGDACSEARRSAGDNGARVLQCDQVGDQLDYVVSVRAEITVESRIRGLPRSVQAWAHAGSA
jgi:secretion/DNA translocation related TadE-like protein